MAALYEDGLYNAVEAKGQILDSVEIITSVLAVRQGDARGTELEAPKIGQVWRQLSMVTSTCASWVGARSTRSGECFEATDCMLLYCEDRVIFCNKHISESMIYTLSIRRAIATDRLCLVLWRLTAGKHLGKVIHHWPNCKNVSSGE